MLNSTSATVQKPGKLPNAHSQVKVRRADLPLHCPMPGDSLWNSHPRVFLPIEDAPDRRSICPYCSTEYILVDDA